MLKSLGDLSISKKVLVSFIVIILLISVNGIYSYVTLSNSTDLLSDITNRIKPAQQVLIDFKEIAKDSRSYATNWVYVESYESDKERLQVIHDSIYPDLKTKILALSDSFTDSIDADILSQTISDFDLILNDQQLIMMTLGDEFAYEDPLAIFLCEDLIENNIVPT
ncbi:MAG: MCP four helix bundle domain-containing protein, partial [Ekhidna sp.]|nr:MCP four helix bundle domain-containing protein [Ekhidna sp.]